MSTTDELLKLQQLLESGVITQEEFSAAKRKILGINKEEHPNEAQSAIHKHNQSIGGNAHHSFINPSVSEFKKRKGMNVLSIICMICAVVYLLMAIGMGSFMLGFAFFCVILSFMFKKLSKVPKASKYIGKNDTGLKKYLFVIMSVVAAYACVIMFMISSDLPSNTQVSTNADPTITDPTKKENDDKKAKKESVEEEPDINLKDDYEKAIWKNLNDKDVKLKYINQESVYEKGGDQSVFIEISSENDEKVVQGIISDMVSISKEYDIKKPLEISIADIDDKVGVMVIADVDTEWNVVMTYESPNYKSARNQWISSQFSAWDGSHSGLTKMIKKSLNDEKSYKHIETTYRNLKDQESIDEINEILKSKGLSTTIEIGDLLVMTQFTAKNGFNATIKSIAYGIASYERNSITLLFIE